MRLIVALLAIAEEQLAVALRLAVTMVPATASALNLRVVLRQRNEGAEAALR